MGFLAETMTLSIDSTTIETWSFGFARIEMPKDRLESFAILASGV